MEINTAITIGLIVSLHYFIFCIIAYYLNVRLFRMNVKDINVFMTFTKPIYSYTTKNGMKINFGYIPLGCNVDFDKDESINLHSAELKRYEDIRKKNIASFQGIMMVFLIVLIFSVTLILGYNPVRIFKDFTGNIYELISGKQNFVGFTKFIHSKYLAYGKYFFIFFAVTTYFIFVTLLNVLASFSGYLSLILSVLIVGSYFVVGIKYFELPITFYIDLFISLIVSGFIFFLSLRFFIK